MMAYNPVSFVVLNVYVFLAKLVLIAHAQVGAVENP